MIPVPGDVVAGMVAFLVAHGVDARTNLPVDFPPGTVRVSRVGGGQVNVSQDEASVLIEVWEKDQPSGFALARRIYALIAAVERSQQDAFPGLTCYEAYPEQSPLQYPDPERPSLDRHQFTVRMLTRLEEVNL